MPVLLLVHDVADDATTASSSLERECSLVSRYYRTLVEAECTVMST